MLKTALLTTAVGAATALAVSAPAALAGPLPPGPDGIAAGQKADVTKMVALIERRLKGQAIGWQFAVADGGKLVAQKADGDARTAVDGQQDMTPQTRINIYSHTKTITAAATLKLLEAAKISVDTPVAPYLPAGAFATKGEGFDGTTGDDDDITFRMLLDHTSGLDQAGNALTQAEKDAKLWGQTWNGTQYAVGKGVTEVPQPRGYTNMNYALLRVLNPEIQRIAQGGNVPQQTAANTGKLNLQYINQRLLQPAGIAPVSCAPADPSKAALAYSANPLVKGVSHQLIGTAEESCAGAWGLWMSSTDITKFHIALRHGTIVSSAVRQQMDQPGALTNLELGWDNDSNEEGEEGVYWHGGTGMLNGSEVTSCGMKFPFGIEAGIIFNSPQTSGTSKCGVLLEAWKAAKG